LKTKVLIVNDNTASLKALRSILVDHRDIGDYEVVTAISGEDALREVLRERFAVILLDVSMPGMDGFETAELIHSHSRGRDVPIIFVTAHCADEVSRLKAYQNGAVDYIFTPVVPQELRNKVAAFAALRSKNMLLQFQTRELTNLNRDLQAQQVLDLQRINATLAAEVAERRQAEERAHALATRDPLTGLLNRRSLLDHLEHAIARAARQKEQLAVLFMDMDRFKAINDTLGHDVGDAVLIEVSERIRGAVRESDVVARLGGDEFVVIMEGLSAAKDAGAVARKIVEANAAPCLPHDHKLKTSVSAGISLFPQDGANVRELMRNADLAMYHAKQHRTGSVEFFRAELNDRMTERMRLESEMQQALACGQFFLYYQPKIDLLTGRITGVEALLRWQHPRHGLLTGASFLSEAADSGLLAPIGEWVLQAACAQVRQWLDAEPALRQLSIAVNIAIPQIADNLPETLQRMLRQHDIPPSCLQLEITESMLIRDLDQTTRVLNEISEGGVTIAVDKFGTGYSSLSVLKALPIDILKIDQSFVRDLGKTAGDTALAAAIVNMARALALRVVAEGVETPEQLTILKSLGCDEAQGNLLGEPVPAARFMRQVRHASKMSSNTGRSAGS
jgi:diguanylate cyclase (GGDEF)-like protein